MTSTSMRLFTRRVISLSKSNTRPGVLIERRSLQTTVKEGVCKDGPINIKGNWPENSNLLLLVQNG